MEAKDLVLLTAEQNDLNVVVTHGEDGCEIKATSTKSDNDGTTYLACDDDEDNAWSEALDTVITAAGEELNRRLGIEPE
jgi:hypothetical protein